MTVYVEQGYASSEPVVRTVSKVIDCAKGGNKIYVGIDVEKDKHDYYICNSDGVELYSPFIIANNLEGFENLIDHI